MSKYAFSALVFICLAPVSIHAQTSLNLTVGEAVEIAMSKNTSIIIAEQKVQEQKAGIGEARSLFFPKLSGRANYTRLDIAPYISFGKKSPFPLPPGSPSKFTIGDENLYDLGFTIMQPLFTGFALKNRYDIAVNSVKSVENEYDTASMDVILQVKEAYYSLLKTREMVKISDESMKLIQAHIADLKRMQAVGLIAENDILKAEVQLSEIKLQKIQTENAAELIEKRLCMVLKISMDTDLILTTPLEANDIEVSLESLTQQAMEKRPEIKSLQNRIEIAKKSVSLVRSQRFPQISALYSWSYKRPNREYEKEFYDSWTVGLNAQLNIFDWGGIHYQIKQAELQKRQAEEGMSQLKDFISLEVTQVYLNLQEAEERIKAAHINVKQAEENYRVTQNKFSEGLVNNTEMLDANAALTRARVAKTSALSDYLTSLANIERVAGKIGK